MASKSIREMLNFQDLSEDEKKARGILGRLYGPCADIIYPTRNGRKYSDKLWKNVFNNNDIVREMIANGGIPMELDHPVDREETCSEKIAAMLPEIPKEDENGHLICYVDLIDTPCGRIAYQLAKYGFKLGISSRGSGDIIEDINGNEEVDPSTYDFTTFDLVLLPAVKDARLSMCESMDTKTLKLKKALTESINSSSEKDQAIMREVLDNLGIEVDTTENNEVSDTVAVNDYEATDNTTNYTDATETSEEIVSMDSLPLVDDNFNLIITEEADIDKETMPVEDSEESDDAEEFEADEEVEVIPVEEEPVEEDEAESTDEAELNSEDFINIIKELGDVLTNPELSEEDVDEFISDKVEQGLGETEFWDELVEVLLDIIDYDSEKSNNKEEVEDKEEVSTEEETEASEEDVSEEAEEAEEEADDDGAADVIESLKEMVRQKDSLEKEVKTLKGEKTVSDAEVKELKEELAKYKSAFERTSRIAAKVKDSEKEIKSLNEQLIQKDLKLKTLKTAQTENLNESVNSAKKQVKNLTEQLAAKDAEIKSVKETLTEKCDAYQQKFEERTRVAKAYRNKLNEALTEYITFRASILGVPDAEITKRLKEGYSIADINAVCDDILDSSMPQVPFNFGTKAKVKFQESIQPKKVSVDNGYDIDDSLLELAGLK